MKRLVAYLSLVFVVVVCQNSSAQLGGLYVGPSSFVHVSDNYVYVGKEVNLDAGNIYLRNQSQLLQGTTAGSTNVGTGALSVFQEGTVNNYAYNYWCSPVGNGAANNPFGVSMLNRPTDLSTSTPATLITGVDGATTNSSLSIASRWVFKFLSSSTYSQWIAVKSATTINAGEGFTMKGTSGTDNTTVLDGRTVLGLPSGTGVKNNIGSAQRYDFRGIPNDGTIDISVGTTGKLTLTGNPYPSAINLNLFLLENSGFIVDYNTGAISLGGAVNFLDNIAYFWDQDPNTNSHTLTAYSGGYGFYIANNTNAFSLGTYAEAVWATYNGDGSVNNIPPGPGAGGTYLRMMSPIGQGFMVRSASATGGVVQMKNSYRVFKKEGVANNSQFNKNSNLDEFWEETPNIAGVDYTKYSKRSLPQIKIHTILNNEFTREMVLAFNPESTDGYDGGKDAKSSSSSLPKDTYFPLDEKNQYVISTLPFAIEKRIPIALKCEGKVSFKLTVGKLINFDLSDTIYLYDKETGIYYDIKNGYFEVSLETSTVDRFEITFQNPTLSTADLAVSKSFLVNQNNEINQLTISNPQLIDLKSITLYNIGGKIVFGKEKLGSNNQYVFSTTSLSDGVYIVKMITRDNLEVNKKIIILKK